MRSRTRFPVPSGEASSMTSTSASGAASWTSSTSGRMLLASLYVGMQTSGRAIRRTIPNVDQPALRIAHLYADEMNIYGDRGNILTLTKRAEWRGIPVTVDAIGRGPAPHLSGGYQLLGEYYGTADGKQLPGLGLVDLHTVPGSCRNIGNIVIETSGLGLEPATLVGFENHSGKTYLGAGLQPLGRVLRGAGNNGQDGYEGVVRGNVFGTYLHGSLLPKNPHFADLLIERALQ